MTPPSRPSTPTGSAAAPEIADAAEHATAEAVVWSAQHAVVVGSAGMSDPPPQGANPILVDGARYHGWLRALDDHGAAIWTRRLETGREVHIRAVAAVGDDLVITGEQRAGERREYTGWVARIAADGTERWRHDHLGTAGVTSLQALAVRSDGSVVAGGMQRGKGWLIAFDAHGKLLWDHPVAGLDEVTAMMTIGDPVIVAGVTGRTTTADGTSRLIAIDASGEARWTTAQPDSGPGELTALAPLNEGGVAVGHAPTGGHDGAWIVRFADNGTIRSSQVLPATGSDSAQAVAATGDGGFIVAGMSYDPVRGRRGCAWRFDAADKLIWQHSYGDGESFARGVAATPDGGAVIVGATQSGTPLTPLRSWIFGVDRLGALRWMAP